jgi:hypothetical protein
MPGDSKRLFLLLFSGGTQREGKRERGLGRGKLGTMVPSP